MFQGDHDFNIGPNGTVYRLSKAFTKPRRWVLPQGGVIAVERVTIVDGVDALADHPLHLVAPEHMCINGVERGMVVVDKPGSIVDIYYASPTNYVVVVLEPAGVEVDDYVEPEEPEEEAEEVEETEPAETADTHPVKRI